MVLMSSRVRSQLRVGIVRPGSVDFTPVNKSIYLNDMTVTKDQILDELRRTAKENGGKPLGRDRFIRETGIKAYEWEKYWPRFGDAQQEAGFEKNQLRAAYPEDFLYEKVIGLIRKLGKFPIYSEYRIERGSDSEFPDKKVFQRFGSKQEFAQKIIEYCKSKVGYDDVVDICTSVIENMKEEKDSGDLNSSSATGEVYLFKSGRYYKIGKTSDTVRRGAELRIQLPENLNLIHSIKTDDPNGVEVYWHKRFEPKRMNGEWFDLTSNEVRAFKAWKRII